MPNLIKNVFIKKPYTFLYIGLSPVQMRRMSKKPVLTNGDEKPNNKNGNRLIASTVQEKASPSLMARMNKRISPETPDSKPSSPVDIQVTAASPPAIRIVNGPGSQNNPVQPNNQFLSKNATPNASKFVTTTIKNTESSL